ncbi:GDSL-type esterase/lipase family protein [Colidextribacter sp. OB.20]|uniref:GDSL-type esterase/lipase family protein n=1 Tax=Colidextribacter sp. OB.20 TaxID=2304568 RepID=UPI0013691FED|nr:GDSL-type esterase/lipase family protein [Colidextribacter sp. OB.20]
MISSFTSVLLASLTALSLALSGCQSLLPDYDYTQPVPESQQREDDWFDNSAVIGHSLMEGFKGFAKVDADIHYFTDTGISAKKALSFGGFDLPDGGTGTLETGLGQKDFDKIYIMLGVNEITTSKESLKEHMAAIVELIRDNQPEGIPIYVLNITPTTEKKSASSDFNQKNVKRLNEALAEVCEEQECYLVDLWSCFADGNGFLPADISTDGVHLTAPEYRVMADYILSHTVGK